MDGISSAIIVFQISGKSHISNRIKVKNPFGDDRIPSVHTKNYISNRIKGQGASKSKTRVNRGKDCKKLDQIRGLVNLLAFRQGCIETY